MKNCFKSMLLLSIIAIIISCEKDEGKLPEISFKTGGTYVSSSDTFPAGAIVTIGIKAAKTEKFDVLKKFNISKSVNGAAAFSVYDKSMSGSDEDEFNYDFVETNGTVSGQANTYTFTITNRDGLVNHVSLTLVVQ